MPCPSDFSALSKTYRNLLIVPPFECAWLADENLRFPEPGRGCITFEACANNDVTVVLKEKAGSKHYRTDKDPNYAIVFGSHRNRRFRIEVDGSTCFEAAAVLVSPSHFERFWISIYDGRITVGKGSPGQGLLFEWAHSDTTRKVEYIGLSSWDKHVGYRNISVLPFSKSLPLSERIAQFALASGGLAQFFERSEFADLRFRVGPEGHLIPVHQVVLACCCSKFSFSEMEIINLASVQYSVLRAFLQYMYTGRTQLPSSKLDDLIRLCEEFGLESLTSECNRVRSGWIDNAGETIVNLEFKAVAEASGCFISTFSNIPIDSSKLEALFCKGENTDVEILVGGSEFVMKAHKLILSAWSVPLLKMFTNGMWESSTTKICVRDVEPDVFLAMLRFMYCGRLVLCQNDELDSFLISLLILADRFGIPLLQHACSLKLIEVLSKELCYYEHLAQHLQQHFFACKLGAMQNGDLFCPAYAWGNIVGAYS
ncbi:hypothetical protein KP509_29G021400 [Ceratopteris richardii]|uniref:BTB domain-containing protein n=1 Tax=Ceratopteris richardii TaxID=49495 RepID=A0A8T2R6Z7_CERRI|nr:hypothetical protein KP509_29G021400 [Ceratopteris richardii]